LEPLDLENFTERQLAGKIQARYLELGHRPSPFGLVATGANTAMPHYVGGDVPINTEQLLLMDFGCAIDGYWSDITRIYFPRDLEEEVEEAYEIVCEAYEAAFDVLEPGVPCQEVDRAARKVIENAGYGDAFLHRTGHGLGLEVHEEPYLRDGNEKPLEVGHVFSVEPGIYLQERFGVRYENIVHLGAHGPEPMNLSPRKHFFNT
jgi:Xaa-Pro dipeptidase